jgi:amidase/aspartyl-tRNA(Asn)/glutamyl-tRNA(Gln) amidotransferase subunit A
MSKETDPVRPASVAAWAETLNVAVTPEERQSFAELLSLGPPLETETPSPPPQDRFDVTFDPGPDVDPLNAFVSRFELGGDEGPLAGVTVALKDNIAVGGVPMTAGSRAFTDVVPSVDAAVTERVLAAGATITGKANQDEFAYSSTGESSGFGPTKNPIDGSRVPGGSSSGSAAAVGAGAVDAALGSDTGGSVRIPAALCGVVGFKPSWGVVPRVGFLELAYPFDTIGPLARDVVTVARVMDAIAGPDDRDPSSMRAARLEDRGFATAATDPGALADCTFGVPDAYYDDTLDAGVRQLLDRRLDELEANGATLTAVSVPSLDDCREVLGVAVTLELAFTFLARGVPVRRHEAVDPALQTALAHALAERGDELGSFLRRKAIEGYARFVDSDGEAYVRTRTATRAITNGYEAVFERCDALVTPTVPVVAPELGRWTPEGGLNPALARATRPANLYGGPALSIPAGTVDGLPVGLQVQAAPYDDVRTVEFGAAIEQVFDR